MRELEDAAVRGEESLVFEKRAKSQLEIQLKNLMENLNNETARFESMSKEKENALTQVCSLYVYIHT